MAAPFSVLDAMILSGINNVDQFNGQTPAERMATEIFDDDFESCIDKTYKELDEDFQSFSSLTVALGRITLPPGVKRNVRAFVQWSQDQIRVGIDPSTVPFPVIDANVLIRRHKTHEKYCSKASTIIDTAKPPKFTDKSKWEEWVPVFLNFLKAIPGRNGVPLKYICRNNDLPEIVPGAEMLDDYVNRAALTGEAFEVDAAEVHTYIVNFVAGNNTAEAKILPHATDVNGRLDFIALRDHYEGVGVNSVNILKAEKVIDSLFYAGEKKPHMWWEEFEKQLTRSFAVYDTKEGRQVYSDEMKLRTLVKKVNADFLNSAKATINLELSRVPRTITYEHALATLRNEVNRKFPPDVSSSQRSRRINQVNSGKDNFSDKSKPKKGNSFQKGNKRKSLNGARLIQGLDGENIEIHPAYNFTPKVWRNIPDHEKDRLRQQRQEYKRRQRVSSVGSMAPSSSMSHPPNNWVITAPQPYYPPLPSPPPPQQVAQVDSSRDSGNSVASNHQRGSTMMGGRNEQANYRQNENSSIMAVHTSKRIISSSLTERHHKFEVQEPPAGQESRNESDSNADTCCLGNNFVVLSMTNKTADVFPYDNSYTPLRNVPIVTGGTAYDDPNTGTTYILVFNESLYYGEKLKHSLLNPNQIRHNHIDFWDNPFDPNHELCIDVPDGPFIPLKFEGTKLLFESRVPTQKELANCIHVEMTSSLDWNPGSVDLNLSISQISRSVDYFDVGGAYTSVPFNNDDLVLRSIEPSLIFLSELTTDHHGEPNDVPARRSFISTDRHLKVSADQLSERWCIGPKRASATLKATTQKGTRSAILPISRRYIADRMYSLKRLRGKFATDTFYPKTKSLNLYTCAQIFSHKGGFAVCYPMKEATGDSIGQALKDFSHDYGVPEHLTFDGASAQVGKDTLFMKTIRKYDIRYHVSGPRRPNENPAESTIREIKKRWYRIMMKQGVPQRLWDYGINWVCETNNLSVSSSRYAGGRTAVEYVTGETPDISEYLDFSFYDLVTYRSNAGLGEISIGRWLGVSHKIGQLMSY